MKARRGIKSTDVIVLCLVAFAIGYYCGRESMRDDIREALRKAFRDDSGGYRSVDQPEEPEIPGKQFSPEEMRQILLQRDSELAARTNEPASKTVK